MIFRRRRRVDAPSAPEAPPGPAPAGQQEPVGPSTASGPPAGAEGTGPSASGGPWDAADRPADPSSYLDLGGLRLPPTEGLELRVEIADEHVVAVTCVLGESALQVAPFAAPRSSGIWAEVRREIAAGVAQQGGTAEEATGPFGPELRAHLPLQTPEGGSAYQRVRFVGVDGPRWFLRGVFSGAAAVDPVAAQPLEQVLRGIVVVRGDEPMPPREPLPLHLPQAAEPPAESSPGSSEPPGPPAAGGRSGGRHARRDLRPFERGPEITETR